MSRISFLRHGVTTAGNRYCGSSDVALSEEGLAQMWEAVNGRRWQRIVSSPLQRCAVFARLLAQRLEVSCLEDSRLREMHFGEWEGYSAAELMERTPEVLGAFWNDPLAHPPPGAESLPALRARVLTLWHELKAEAGDEGILLVTHGGPIRILLAEQSSRPLSHLMEIEVGYAQLFDTTALTQTERA